VKLVKATKDLRLVNAHNALKGMRATIQSGGLRDERKFDLLVLDTLVLLSDNVLGTTLPAKK
jgi:hypothetical protein